jgi:hypothetical protein
MGLTSSFSYYNYIMTNLQKGIWSFYNSQHDQSTMGIDPMNNISNNNKNTLCSYIVSTTYKIVVKCYLEFLAIPLGLANAPDTFQSCSQWQWHLVLSSDANNIFNKTWRVHLSKLGEACRIISMPGFFHLGYVVRALEEIQIVLDQFTEI